MTAPLSDFSTRLHTGLQAAGLDPAGQPDLHLLVAYSGGVDSTVLLHALVQLKTLYPMRLTAAYFDHGWRGTPAPELPRIHKNCLAYEVPLVLIPGNRSHPQNEALARKERYRELLWLAKDIGADAVATAHHADDQVETLLFRLFRGTGVEGLVGIQNCHHMSVEGHPEHARIPVVRPMLDLTRTEIQQYAEAQGLYHYEDTTNEDTRFSRNAIRHDILPLLDAKFPQMRPSLLRLREVAEGEAAILEQALAPLYAQLIHHTPETGWSLDVLPFSQLGRPYQRRVVKRFLENLGFEPGFQAIEEMASFIEGQQRDKQRAVALKSMGRDTHGTPRFLRLSQNRLTLISKPVEATETPLDPTPVIIPGVQPTPYNNQMLQITELTPELLAKLPTSLPPPTRDTVYVDLSIVRGKPLVLRTRRPGDRFQPLGMEEPMRLKSFFINRSIPQEDRSQLPFLAFGREVLWIPGHGLSELLRVQEGTRPTHALRFVSAEVLAEEERLAALKAEAEAKSARKPDEDSETENDLETDDPDDGGEPEGDVNFVSL